MLERASERAALQNLVDVTNQCRGGTVVIEGPAGIGKTRLVGEALSLAAEAGVGRLSARCHDLEREFAFGVVRQLFEPRLRQMSPSDRGAAFVGPAGHARSVFSGLEPRVPEMDVHAVMHGLYWLTVNLAGDRPLLLCVDDGHWADAASLRWLSYLANRVDGVCVGLVVALRSREPNADQALLDGLPRTRTLYPQALSERAVGFLAASVIGDEPDPEFVAACARATAGNPFFVIELLDALARDAVVPHGDAAARLVELAAPGVERAIMRRFATLPAVTVAVARAVAVLGVRADPRSVSALASIGRGQAAATRDLLVDVSILEPSGRAFRHPIVRAAVLSDVPGAQRAVLHRRAARYLHRDGAADDEVAAHLLVSESGGERWAASALTSAAELATARGAPEVAVTLLQRALDERAPGLSEADLRWELGKATVAARGLAGVIHLRRATTAEADPVKRTAILLDAGRALYTHGMFPEAFAVLKEASAEPGADTSAVRGLQAHIALTDLRVLRSYGGLDGLARTVEESPDRDSLLEATRAWLAVARKGSADVGARLALEVLTRSPAADPPVYAGALTALAAAGWLDESRAGWNRVIAQARRDGSVAMLRFALVMRAPVILRLGEVQEAEADLREVTDLLSVDHVSPAGQAGWLPWLLAPLLDCLVERDKVAEAATSDELVRLGDDVFELVQGNLLLSSRARLRFAEGRPSEAVALLRARGRGMCAWGVRNPGFGHWRSDLALALVATGEHDEAAQLCVEQEALAREFGLPREEALALRSRALATPGREAVETLEQAVELVRKTADRLDLARCLVDLGGVLRRAGRRGVAREPLREGLDLAHRCGAIRLAGLAHQELVASGAKPRRLALSGAAALTPSELRTSRRAAEGMSNREIAQALFVTEKTVEGHLANSFRKLEVSSRSQLGEALKQTGS